MLNSQGEAKAQQYIDTLWSACNFEAKGFSKPSACYYPFEKDVDARDSSGRYAVGQWICAKCEILENSSSGSRMELKSARQVDTALETAKKELSEVNEDARSGGNSCWHRESRVMRYDRARQEYR